MCRYHKIPIEVFRLGVEAFIPSSNSNLIGPKQVYHLHFQRPEAPAPILAIFVWFLSMVQCAHVPRFSTIKCYLNTSHFSSSTCTRTTTLSVTLHPLSTNCMLQPQHQSKFRVLFGASHLKERADTLFYSLSLLLLG